MNNYHFYRSLHGRGLTTTRLAVLACGSAGARAHVGRVIAGKVGHGTFTRQRLVPFLTRSEVRLLGWEKEFDRWRRRKARHQKKAVRDALARDVGLVLKQAIVRSTRNIEPIPSSTCLAREGGPEAAVGGGSAS